MSALRILKGPNEGAVIRLPGERFVLGRNRDADLCLPITSISRRHAEIIRSGGQYFIEDLKSRNNTFVNNRAIKGRTALKNDDRIRICDFIAAFLEESNNTEYILHPDRPTAVMDPPILSMTEEQWLASSDPLAMLNSLGNRIRERKVRLFACACCQRVWHLLESPPARAAHEATERYADGLISDRDLRDISIGRWAEIESLPGVPEHKILVAVQAAALVSRSVTRHGLVGAVRHVQVADEDRSGQAHLLRDIVGNPHRTVSADPAWLAWDGGMVGKMAQAIYDDRSFDELPVLADALEEAGCSETVLLEHCRSREPHAKGCWAVDLLLGRA